MQSRLLQGQPAAAQVSLAGTCVMHHEYLHMCNAYEYLHMCNAYEYLHIILDPRHYAYSMWRDLIQIPLSFCIGQPALLLARHHVQWP